MSNSLSHILRSTLWGKISFGLLIALPIIILNNNGTFQGLENRLDDRRVRHLSSRMSASEDIVVIAIDDESLSRMQNAVGTYPWPRDLYAALISHCEQAKVLIFDIIFAETDQQFRGYEYFIETVKENGKVISSAYLNETGAPRSENTYLENIALNTYAKVESPVKYPSVTVPFDELQLSSKAIGHANFLASPDGVVRTYLLGGESEGKYIPSLALASALAITGQSPENIFDIPNEFWLNNKKIPLNKDGSFNYIPHKIEGKFPPYKTYRIADIFNASQESLEGKDPEISPGEFKDKIVFIGALAVGLADDVPTSVSPIMPGVYVHASALDNVLNGNAITRTSLPVTIFIILFVSLLPAIINTGGRLNLLLGLGVLTAVFYITLSYLLLIFFNHLIPLTSPLSAMVLTFILLSLLYWNIERARRHYLEMMEKAKQSFTDMLVHDLKGRVSTMVMSIDLMEHKLKDQPHEMKLLNTMRSSGSRLISQVHALLDIRKIEEGQMKLNQQPANMIDVLREVITEYQTSATIVNLTIEERFDDESDPMLLIDIDIFQRIMGNLIWNAIQYARKNTTIVISYQNDGETLQVTVSNEGKIIPPEIINGLFKPFSSGENNQDKNVKTVSTGLGLSFCKLAMEAHGGGISILSPWPEKADGVQLILSFPNKP